MGSDYSNYHLKSNEQYKISKNDEIVKLPKKTGGIKGQITKLVNLVLGSTNVGKIITLVSEKVQKMTINNKTDADALITLKNGIEKTYRRTNKVSRFINGKLGSGTNIKQEKEKLLDNVYHSLEHHFFGQSEPNSKITQSQRHRLDTINELLSKTDPNNADLASLDEHISNHLERLVEHQLNSLLYEGGVSQAEYKKNPDKHTAITSNLESTKENLGLTKDAVLQKLAVKGYPAAQLSAARSLESKGPGGALLRHSNNKKGESVVDSLSPDALNMYTKAASSGNLSAQLRLETAFRKEANEAIDPSKANKFKSEAHNWAVKAAVQNKDDSAWMRMANDIRTGYGVAKNLDAAIANYRAIKETSSNPADRTEATMQLGVLAEQASNRDEAKSHYQAATKMGHPEAQAGVERMERSIYETAAKAGDINAMQKAAEYKAEGKGGPQDIPGAIAMYIALASADTTQAGPALMKAAQLTEAKEGLRGNQIQKGAIEAYKSAVESGSDEAAAYLLDAVREERIPPSLANTADLKEWSKLGMGAVLQKAASGELSPNQAQRVLIQVAETTPPAAALGKKFAADTTAVKDSFAKLSGPEKQVITNLVKIANAAGNEGPNFLARALAGTVIQADTKLARALMEATSLEAAPLNNPELQRASATLAYCLDSIIEGLRTDAKQLDGIFRLASTGTSTQLQERIENTVQAANAENKPITADLIATAKGSLQINYNDIGDVAKRAIRDLKSPLLNKEVYLSIANIAADGSDEKIAEALGEKLKMLGAEQKTVLQQLLTGLNQVLEREDDTRMTARNLAVVWAPNVFIIPDGRDPMSAMKDVGNTNKFFEIMIKYPNIVLP